MGLIGILSFLVGAALLWQARKEILYWLQEFFRILRAEFSRHGGLTGEVRRASPSASSGVAGAHRPRRSRGALLLLGGFTLIVLGQVLFILGLAF
jgi:hypothetical protein